MSSLEGDRRYGNFASAMRFAHRQLMKSVATALPGIVENFEPRTRRATVRGALNIVTTNGAELQRASLVNVPVLWPSGGGYTLAFQLAVGDPVLLVYSMRGLEQWKQSHSEATPDEGVFFDESDAIAIPGFGPAAEIALPTQRRTVWDALAPPLRGGGVGEYTPATPSTFTLNGYTFVNAGTAPLGGRVEDVQLRQASFLYEDTGPRYQFDPNDRLTFYNEDGTRLGQITWGLDHSNYQRIERNGLVFHRERFQARRLNIYPTNTVVRAVLEADVFYEASLGTSDSFIGIGPDGVSASGDITARSLTLLNDAAPGGGSVFTCAADGSLSRVTRTP